MDNKDYIDFALHKAFFEGRVTRKDLIDRFDIKESTATKIFSLISEKKPGQIIYHPRSLGYVPSEDYRTKNKYRFSDYLNIVGHPDFSHQLETVNSGMDMDKFRAIQKAIKNELAIEFDYLSLNTPEPSSRIIYPHSLISSGFRWHIRGWEESSATFKDFNLPRIQGGVSVVKIKNSLSHIENDNDWNTYKTFFLIPNPQLNSEQKKIIEIDYQMTNGVLAVSCRKALFLYTLHTYLVTDQSENPNRHQHLALRE
ncbi:MAG: WYL domain-containing protein [Methyloprofundus sp.]|nr:WYL domain-containing protein [Methyloprofundus sp.]